MAIDLGDLYRLTFTLTSPAGGAVNADSVSLTITLPDGTTTTPAVTNPPAQTGQYVVDYITTQAGRHLARWVATGANVGAHLDAFDVLPGDASYLFSLADAKATLNIDSTGSDEEVRDFLGSVTIALENHLGEVVARRSFTEQCESRGGAFVLNRIPVAAITSVATIDGAHTWNPEDLNISAAGVVTAVNGIAPYGRLNVVYTAGPPIVPANYLMAGRIILQHLWNTQRGTVGAPRAGSLPDSMQLGQGHFGYALPNAAIELLGAGLPGIA